VPMTNLLNRSESTHRRVAEVGEGQVTVGASAASLPNSSGANARTVVVRAFPDDLWQPTYGNRQFGHCVAIGHFDDQSHVILTGGDISANQSSAEFRDQSLGGLVSLRSVFGRVAAWSVQFRKHINVGIELLPRPNCNRR
jgi:hypothetical protein